MKPKQRELAISAFRELAPHPDSVLIDAVRLYKEHATDDMRPKALDDTVEDFLQACEGNVEDITISNDYAPKLTRLAAGSLAIRQIYTIRTEELEEWLNINGYRNITRMNYRTRFVTLWQFTVDRNHAKTNVARGIKQLSRQKRKKLRNVPPAIMCADEIQSLLDATLDFREGEMLPYFAVCALAGLRPWEAQRLSWENIDLKAKQIHFPAEASKTGDDRDVPMPDSLVEWLEAVPMFSRQGLLPWSRHGFEKVREIADLKARWREPKGSDILRHSAASHHYRLNDNNMNLTAAVMGHDVSVFKSHYKSRVRTMAEARAYFSVTPKAKTLRFKKTA